jgi:hypothetical protein
MIYPIAPLSRPKGYIHRGYSLDDSFQGIETYKQGDNDTLKQPFKAEKVKEQ